MLKLREEDNGFEGKFAVVIRSTFGKLKKKIAFQHVNINILYIWWGNITFFLTQ